MAIDQSESLGLPQKTSNPEVFKPENEMQCRDSATQLALLDRVAGTRAGAAKFGNQLQQVKEVEEQLADIATLGDEEERDELQQMIEEVGPGNNVMANTKIQSFEVMQSSKGCESTQCSAFVTV